MGFQDKTVIVTGGAQGIGMAISLAFAQAGARVVIADIDTEAGEEHLAVLRTSGHTAFFTQTDVAEPESVAAMMNEVVARDGRIDVLVNNAGYMETLFLVDRPVESWDHCLAVNLRGPFLCARQAVPHMPAGAAIINIASTRALMSEPNTEPYSASKAGLLGLTHAMAASLAARRIRVNAVSPGWIDVTAWKKQSRRAQTVLNPRDHEQHLAGRVGRPEDVAQACLFLADTGKSGFITGQNIVIDGGMTVKMIYEE